MSDSDDDDMYGSGDEEAYDDVPDAPGGAGAAASASASSSSSSTSRMAVPRMYPPPFADEAAAMTGTGYTVLGRQASYDVYSEEDLEHEWMRMLEELQDVTGTRPHVAEAVLQLAEFDLERAKSLWFQDTAKALAATKAIDADDPPPPPAEWGDEELVTCEVCYDDCPRSDMDALPCGHWFCRGCWAGHLKKCAEAKATLLSPTCQECEHPVSYRLLRQFLETDPKSMRRWRNWKFGEMAALDTASAACPHGDCGYVCKYPKGVARDIICPSGHIFCFACGQQGHAPAGCEDTKAWRKKLAGDGLDSAWIKTNCRPCPKCGVMIEKNQGCMQMTCGKHAHTGRIAKGSGCGLVFCWTCMKPYSEHNKGCVAWIPSADVRLADKELQVFARTSAHVDTNMVGRNEALKLLPEVRDTMVALSESTALALQRLSHLEEAVHEIAESRRTVAWSHVWQHYRGKEAGARADLFLHNQKNLSELVERLQRLIEGAPGELSVSKSVATKAAAAGSVTGDDMAALVDDGMRIRDLLARVRRFREDVVVSVQVCTAELESARMAGSA